MRTSPLGATGARFARAYLNGTLIKRLVCIIAVVAVAVSAELRAGEHKTAWACYTAENPPSAGEDLGTNADRLINLHVYDVCDGETLQPGKPACGVTYEKNGVLETLWEANSDKDYCQPHAEALAETLEQAGFDCATIVETSECSDALTQEVGKKSQAALTEFPPAGKNGSPAPRSDEQREVDAYLNLVRSLAAQGDTRFARELDGFMAEAGAETGTPVNGVSRESFFRAHWKDVKTSAVMKQGLQVWIVQSAYCSPDACASIVVQPLPSASNFSELKLVDVFEGDPTLKFIDCVAVDGARACWRDATNRPIYHVQQSNAESLYLYDSETQKYTTYLTCQKSMGIDGKTHAYRLFSPLQPGDVLDSGLSEYEKVCEGVLLNVLLHNATNSFARRELFASNK